jgi:hypothetical protein
VTTIIGTLCFDATFIVRDLGGGIDLSTADEYRRYAAECMALAERLASPDDKSRLIQMAQAFLELADRRQKLDPQSE